MIRSKSLGTGFSLETLGWNTRCVIFLGVTLLFYKAVAALLYGSHVAAGSRLFPYIIVGLIAVGGIGIGYKYATRPLRILLRSIIAFALFYVVASRVSVPEALLEGNRLADFELNTAWMIAAAFGVGGFFRPSLGIVPLHFILWQKKRLSSTFEIDITWLDYVTLIETGSILIVGLLIFVVLRRMLDFPDPGRSSSISSSGSLGQATQGIHPLHLLVLLAVALHFGNYFYAGLIKAALGAHPLDWVFRNETYYLVLAAWHSNALPIAFSETLTAWTYMGLEKVFVFTNFITFGTQIFALLAIVRIKWAIWTTLCYDALHVIIWLTTGIFFWKFIILNLALVAALTPIRHLALPRRIAGLMVLAVAFSPYFFQIMPSFAWLDTRSLNHVRFAAVTKDGTEVPVPTNYFLGLSVTFAQDRFVWPNAGVFPTWTWGTTRDLDEMEPGLACELPLTTEQDRQFYYVPKEHISRLVQRHHRLILSKVDDNGYFDYDLFPHHIWSMPWMFGPFKQLDKREIVAYRYVNQAICLDFKDGELQIERKSKHTFDIPVGR